MSISCVILVATHGRLIENEIKESGKYSNLEGVPKALLPGVGGKRILDYWWDVIKTQLFNEIYLVTNADKYKHFERWATASDFPVANIVNNGTTQYDKKLGTVRDIELVLRIKSINEDLFVIAGDMLFQDDNFDLAQVLKYFRQKKKESGDLAIYYEMLPIENRQSRGTFEVCHKTNKIIKYFSRSNARETTSRNASVVFYGFRKETLSTINSFLSEFQESSNKIKTSWSTYLEWLVNVKQNLVFGLKLPSGFQFVGNVGLQDYEHWLRFFEQQAILTSETERITKRAYARVGLMGNPSDGFFGKTIALSISNFWAEVTLYESKKLCILPHPLNDPTEFGGLGDLYGISKKDGYLGGLRLLQATLATFYQYCCDRGIALSRRNFTVKYDTNIPRQVGLAGSSAIITACLKCLMKFYNLSEYDMPKDIQPQIILDAEKAELRINAGLQDRVVQVYEGLVYMDFSEPLMKCKGYGNYEQMRLDIYPSLWLAYIADPSDSSVVHSDVSLRWQKGDEEVLAGMKKFAKLTDEAKIALQNKDWTLLNSLMNSNLELRKQIYGESAFDEKTLRMIDIAQQYGSCVKLPGSGGAVVGMCLENNQMKEMRKIYQNEGFVIVDINPNLPAVSNVPRAPSASQSIPNIK